MKPPSSRFALAVCGIVALLSFSNTRNFYELTQDRTSRGDPYDVLPVQARFEGVVSQLPAVNVFGYLNEPLLDQFTADKKLLGARYAVAPRMLAPQEVSPQQWVIGDFSLPIDLDSFAQANGLAVVRDFGHGVVLFQRTSRP
jgi:hypothetical protein